MSRYKSRKKVMKNYDGFVIGLTMLAIISICGLGIFAVTHTSIELNKNEKGEISLIIDYNKDKEVEAPGQEIMPMFNQVLGVVKDKIKSE